MAHVLTTRGHPGSYNSSYVDTEDFVLVPPFCQVMSDFSVDAVCLFFVLWGNGTDGRRASFCVVLTCVPLCCISITEQDNPPDDGERARLKFFFASAKR